MGEYWEFFVMFVQALWRLLVDAGMPIVKAYFLFTILCLIAYTLMGVREDEVEESVEKFGQLGEELAELMAAFHDHEPSMMGFHRRGVVDIIEGMSAEDKATAKILVEEFFERFPRWANRECICTCRGVGQYTISILIDRAPPSGEAFRDLMLDLQEIFES